MIKKFLILILFLILTNQIFSQELSSANKKKIDEKLENISKMSDKTEKSKVYIEIGNIYLTNKNYDQAVAYYNKALNLSTDDTYNKMFLNNLIAYVYLENQQYDQAKIHYNEGFTYAKALGNEKTCYSNLKNLGMIYFLEEDFESAKKYYNKAWIYAKKLGVNEYIEEMNQKYAEVEEILEKLRQNQDNDITYSQISVDTELKTTLEDLKSEMNVLKYRVISDSLLKDSLSNLYKLKLRELDSADIQIAKKHQQINKLIDINTKQKLYITIFIALLSTIIILLILIIRSYYIKKSQNNQLKIQKKQIEETNIELSEQKEELQVTLNQLQQTQSELIQSEKMASLGQLIAGIAHEINTPIGAIKASSNTVIISATNTLEKLPKLLLLLNSEQQNLLIELITIVNIQHKNFSSKEEREFKKAIKQKLDELNIENSRKIADKLVDMQLFEGFEKFLPLFTCQISTEILNVAYDISELVRNSQNISIATEKVAKIIFALKTYARKDASGEKIKTNISEGIETVLTLYHNQLKQQINVIKKYDDIPEILCYQDELNQVWTNIIHNSIQAMEGKGELIISINEIEIDLQSNKKGILIKFADNGKGIPQDIQDKIFEAFFTTKPAGEGTGLGLDIVKRIIEKHSGKIWFESKEGEGTTFFVELPQN